MAAVLSGFAQTTANAGPGLPQDPRELFAAAAPLYDFASPDLKPWHLKATYQLYDEKGKPTEQGTYEYWWASPTVYRSTWTRPRATHTDWHTADGKRAHQEAGEHAEFFEYELQSALLSPLPDASELDPDKSSLSRETVSSGGVKLPCVMVTPLMPQQGRKQSNPPGLFPTYCFDPQSPTLRVRYSFGHLSTEFGHAVNMQDKYLDCEITVSDGNRKILTGHVDTITLLDPTDPALTPSADAMEVKVDKAQQISALVMSSMLLKQQAPVYPQDAKNARASGTVVLRAIIGMDGSVHDLRVVSAPHPSLAASALWAVSHWEYKPYLLDGEPVDVETTVNVIYSLGN
ncbi:MAG: energy transducer TonB [Terracidiphilus sp.]